MVAALAALVAGLLAVGYTIWPSRRLEVRLTDELAGLDAEAVVEAAAAALRAWSAGGEVRPDDLRQVESGEGGADG